MREIKFRAWHKEMKLMYRVLSLVLGQREQEARLVRYDTTLVRYEGPAVTCHLDEIELMQYTGLKDKNGKEVYEGDIVDIVRILTTIPTQPFNERGLITYTAPEFHASGHSLQGYEYEVIGNIYENPELFY